MGGHIMRILALVVQFIAQAPRRIFPVFTWATRPNASNYIWGFVWITDIGGGTLFRSNGTRWVPVSQQITLANWNTDASVSATTSTENLRAANIPDGLVGPNDEVFFQGLATISGNTNSKTIQVVAGPSSAVLGSVATNTSVFVSLPFRIGFVNRGATNSQCGSAAGDSATSVAVQTATFDSSAAFDITLTGRKAVAGDTLTVNRARLVLRRGVD